MLSPMSWNAAKAEINYRNEIVAAVIGNGSRSHGRRHLVGRLRKARHHDLVLLPDAVPEWAPDPRRIPSPPTRKRPDSGHGTSAKPAA